MSLDDDNVPPTPESTARELSPLQKNIVRASQLRWTPSGKALAAVGSSVHFARGLAKGVQSKLNGQPFKAAFDSEVVKSVGDFAELGDRHHDTVVNAAELAGNAIVVGSKAVAETALEGAKKLGEFEKRHHEVIKKTAVAAVTIALEGALAEAGHHAAKSLFKKH